MKRFFLLAATVALCSSFMFPQDFSSDAAESVQNSSENSSNDSFDDIFNEMTDVDEPVVIEQEKKVTATDLKIGSLSMPVEVSGSLSTSFGAAFVKKDVFIESTPVASNDYETGATVLPAIGIYNSTLQLQNEVFTLDTNNFEDYVKQKLLTSHTKTTDTDPTLYFALTNYFYITARPDRYLNLKISLKTNLTDDDEANEDNQNQYLYLYEMYFDYLVFNKIYITAGKKKTVWGNIRLFSDSTTFGDTDSDALYTNILYDSRKNISGIVRIPFGLNSLTGVVMYDTSTDSPGIKNMSIAGNFEFVYKGFSFNIFGRRFPTSSDSSTTDLTKTLAETLASTSSSSSESASTTTSVSTSTTATTATVTTTTSTEEETDDSKQHILGAEFKTSILGFDIYGQSLARVAEYKKLKKIFTSHGTNVESLSKVVSTVGFYKLWSEQYPYVGINLEYQNIHNLNVTKHEKEIYTTEYGRAYEVDAHDEWGRRITTDAWKNRFTNRIAMYAGLAKLGPDRNIKVGAQWIHDFSNNVGSVSPAVIISRIFPHCDLNIGAKYEYYDMNTSSKVTTYSTCPAFTTDVLGVSRNHTITYAHRITLGAYFTVTLDY